MFFLADLAAWRFNFWGFQSLYSILIHHKCATLDLKKHIMKKIILILIGKEYEEA
jgi:hypothetical protein